MKNSIVTINGKRGEYTGWSRINGAIIHYFSMYDGSIIKCGSLEGILPASHAFEAPVLPTFNYPESLLK